MEILKTQGIYENLVRPKKIPDIYTGEEIMRFDNRHPIYKTLMKLEFEAILRTFSKASF